MPDVHPSYQWRNRAYESLRGSAPAEPALFAELMRHDRFPRACAYDPAWIWSNHMGPNVLWLTDALTQSLDLRPGMRVLDMGCGTALSSIFLAREFDVEVWAVDLWVPPHDNFARIQEAGLMERVYPLHAEGRAYPFQRDFFDAALSVDSYHYWGCDEAQLDYVASFVRPGGVIGIIVPGDSEDANPDGTFHSAEWWQQLWNESRTTTVLQSQMLDGGWDLWWRFCEAASAWSGEPVAEVGDAALLQDNPALGFTSITARRAGGGTAEGGSRG